jgi:hypothetical protein
MLFRSSYHYFRISPFGFGFSEEDLLLIEKAHRPQQYLVALNRLILPVICGLLMALVTLHLHRHKKSRSVRPLS